MRAYGAPPPSYLRRLPRHGAAAALVSAADRNKSVRIKNVTDLKFLMHSLLPWILNGSLIAAAVFIHYETLYSMARHLPNLTNIPPRYRVLLGVFVILVAHAVEIWVFAVGLLHYGSPWFR